jgi:hypothetical protein
LGVPPPPRLSPIFLELARHRRRVGILELEPGRSPRRQRARLRLAPDCENAWGKSVEAQTDCPKPPNQPDAPKSQPKWLQSLSWEKASTKSATVKEVRRQTDKNLKQQRAQ